ncbi:UDP-GlcNAc:undecaprenyl-phosphate GlcNAc-1-phosphate transferase [Peptoniphilus asaccharolyticus DSM 20463]|uniref:UDP-GlcNAc:undecaprenyl-phosphate GlcNAc-1-phosphate transferase n=1 Tax=Peptoniphilus asaccharolyticus DSM 20463 TaxID=573058 RepID=A0A1W1VLQ3_PEPAS|nr:MraY family glycosyltransferase [Peptoniphilus asaccharolyticus]MBL7574468.1 undecaprenyl/decaprenyl-phosphate alpha-N-acetylglucosaminyl 1-phosphate transferase [Peptoniphilus asaccharolyticus]SMB93874.1 UDP-GlcNAc:undecaprenyl-phosphate GlcNAc-1-phosphate transferase [Peptoniphilus asaccharolyticus DSM 20463]
MAQLLKPIVLAFLVSLVMTPIVIRLAKKFGFLDIPKDARRMHNKPIPLSGGVAMYVAIMIGMIVFLKLNRELICVMIGATLILISGLIDDKTDMSPKMKLLFQLTAALILIVGNVRVEFFTNPFPIGETVIFLGVLSIPITIFWIVGITNTVNLIDGMDGLAAGVSLICSISLMVIANKFGYGNMAIIAALLVGACAGFLPYNFNPAKIFMGDTGALFLGFMLSYISVEGIMKSAAALTIIVPVLILGVPVFDTTFAMIRRKLSGKKIMQADKGHLHHRLLALGLTQKQTVLTLYVISIIFGLLAIVVAKVDAKTGLFISALVIAGIIVMGIFSGMFKSKEE